MRGEVHAANTLLVTSPLELGILKNSWHVNAIRAQIILQDDQLRGIATYGLTSNTVIYTQIKTLLDAAHSKRLGVILDLHRPEGGSEGASGKLWQDPALQDRLVELWRKLAPVFKDHPALLAYDILNEPTPPDDFYKSFNQIRGGMQDWNVLARRIVKAIRTSDVDVPLIVETTDWAKPFRFNQLERIDDPHIVYSFHMYHPFALTHQGVRQFEKNQVLTYPGVYEGKLVDKAALSVHMEAARGFAAKYQVPIFVGEFGINKFAPPEARAAYIKDLLAIFASNHWSWGFHAFQIWDGWMPNEGMLDALVGSGTP